MVHNFPLLILVIYRDRSQLFGLQIIETSSEIIK